MKSFAESAIRVGLTGLAVTLVLLGWAVSFCFPRDATEQRPSPHGPQVTFAPKSGPATAQRAWVFATDYRQSLKRSEAVDKPLLLVFAMRGCLYCDKLAVAFADKRLEWVGGSMVPCRVQRETNQDVVKAYKVSRYPTIIVQHRKRIVGTNVGYLAPMELSAWLRLQQGRAKQAEKRYARP